MALPFAWQVRRAKVNIYGEERELSIFLMNNDLLLLGSGPRVYLEHFNCYNIKSTFSIIQLLYIARFIPYLSSYSLLFYIFWSTFFSIIWSIEYIGEYKKRKPVKNEKANEDVATVGPRDARA